VEFEKNPEEAHADPWSIWVTSNSKEDEELVAQKFLEAEELAGRFRLEAADSLPSRHISEHVCTYISG